MLKIMKVTGHSMHPRYRDGDFVILSTGNWPILKVHAGDDIVFEHEIYGMLIKRIERIDSEKNGIFVLAEHEDGLDSRELGWIDAGYVRGKVIRHIRQ